jgi:DNA polymerase I-like protein with 3'-5' exonuclease and polymerase domains
MGCKTAGMASLYAGGPGEVSKDNPDVFPTSTVARYYQDAFFDLCPKVRAWHTTQCEVIERQGYLNTPIGFRLHAEEPFTYKKRRSDGVWERTINQVGKGVIASWPQHVGAMYLMTAALAFMEEYPEMGQWVRLLIHDEIFGEPPTPQCEAWLHVLQSVMERPHPLMPLDWVPVGERGGMDEYLAIKTEAKQSTLNWADMK